MSSAEPKAESDKTYRDLCYKQLLDEVFYDVRNDQDRVNCYQLSRRPRLIALTETSIT